MQHRSRVAGGSTRAGQPGYAPAMDRLLRIEPGEEPGSYALTGDVDLASAAQVRDLVPPD